MPFFTRHWKTSLIFVVESMFEIHCLTEEPYNYLYVCERWGGHSKMTLNTIIAHRVIPCNLLCDLLSTFLLLNVFGKSMWKKSKGVNTFWRHCSCSTVGRGLIVYLGLQPGAPRTAGQPQGKPSSTSSQPAHRHTQLLHYIHIHIQMYTVDTHTHTELRNTHIYTHWVWSDAELAHRPLVSEASEGHRVWRDTLVYCLPYFPSLHYKDLIMSLINGAN